MNIEYYSAKKKKKEREILPVSTTWKDLEDITFSEISQRQIQYDLIYM